MPVSGSNGYKSGIVTLPNRVRIREMDSRTGMYPTIARTGDATRGGNLSIPEFDDAQTVIFEEGASNLFLGSSKFVKLFTQIIEEALPLN